VHSSLTPDGTQVTGQTTAAPRDEQIPVSERRLSGQTTTEAPLTNTAERAAALDRLGQQQEGVLLVDSEGRPVEFIPMSADTMRTLRTGQGGGSETLFNAMDRTGAAGFIARTNDVAAAGNLNGFAANTGRPLIDVIDSRGASMKDAGAIPAQSTFYANPFVTAVGETGFPQHYAAASLKLWRMYWPARWCPRVFRLHETGIGPAKAFG